jgi:hypothetical protein
VPGGLEPPETAAERLGRELHNRRWPERHLAWSIGPDLALSPPLLTQTWLRRNAKALDRLQLEGEVCVFCGQKPRTMVPVGKAGTHQLFACIPACAASLGPNHP